MIVVCGTGRSGTSMWMQALAAGGCALVGEEFPLDWRERFYEANRQGFYESTLVGGINFKTNPNPATGAYLDPSVSREVAVKVMLPGLPRTRRVYLHRVIVSVRGWRAFVQSRLRANAILRAYEGKGPATPSAPLWMKWWVDHAQALLDARDRGYPCRFVSYDEVLADPGRAMAETLEWLDVGLDVEAATSVVDPGLQTQSDPVTPPDVGASWVQELDHMESLLTGARVPAEQELSRVQRVLDQVATERSAPDPWKRRPT